MLSNQSLELADETCSAAAAEIGIDTRFDCRQPELFQSCDFGLRPRLVHEVGQRGAAPEL